MAKLYCNGTPISTDGENPFDMLFDIAKEHFVGARISRDGKRLNMIGYGEVVLCYEYGQETLTINNNHYVIY